MDVLELLVGKKMKVMTDMKVEVELEIASVKENHRSVEIGPSTRENDWYPETRNWTTLTVTFTNGAKKEFDNLTSIKIL